MPLCVVCNARAWLQNLNLVKSENILTHLFSLTKMSTKSPSNMFTEEEIIQELHELGVQLPPEQLAHIKQGLLFIYLYSFSFTELDALLALEHWSTHSVNENELQQFPHATTTENVDALRVLEQARRMHEQVRIMCDVSMVLERGTIQVVTRYRDDIRRVTDGEHGGDVLHQAQLLSELVHKDIARIDAVVSVLSRMFYL
jgi:hypothetical protein